MQINKIKGTKDYFGKDVWLYRFIEDKAKEICRRFGYQEIITPIFEYTELFSRGVGEGSDIVNKEMYTFIDKGSRSITLRPEGTASVTRAFVENKLYVNRLLTKIFYFGPMFRYEQPQAGRYRQFHQFGIEALGQGGSYLDADVIYMAANFLKELGIKNYTLLINTIGNQESRKNYEQALVEYFSIHIDKMCSDCKKRLSTNPLRILDCKVDHHSEIMNNAPQIHNYLSEDDKLYFENVIKVLDGLEVSYCIDQKLVRGLDYYNSIVFEFLYNYEGSKINGITLLGGGRYNGLSQSLNGPQTEAIGYACGVERLMQAVEEQQNLANINNCEILIITLGQNQKLPGLKIVNTLRNNDIYAEIDYQNHNLKPQFKLSERLNCKFIVVIGEEELLTRTIKIKNTLTRHEENIKIDELANYIVNNR